MRGYRDNDRPPQDEDGDTPEQFARRCQTAEPGVDGRIRRWFEMRAFRNGLRAWNAIEKQIEERATEDGGESTAPLGDPGRRGTTA